MPKINRQGISTTGARSAQEKSRKKSRRLFVELTARVVTSLRPRRAHCILEHGNEAPLCWRAGTIRLEPLEHRHVDGLVAASATDRALYQWSPVPQGKAEATSLRRDRTGLAGRGQCGAVRDRARGGWRWSSGPPASSTWSDGCGRRVTRGTACSTAARSATRGLRRSAIRTAANTEAKLLMLTHAFETWQMLRVCFHTDVRNQRSRAALERIGGKFEGILRSHRMAADFIARDSARYSIVAAEWPEVKRRLTQLLAMRAEDHVTSAGLEAARLRWWNYRGPSTAFGGCATSLRSA